MYLQTKIHVDGYVYGGDWYDDKANRRIEMRKII